MFGISFSELGLVVLIALLVFGPDRLPGALRTAGLWSGRIKRGFDTIRQDVERELGADEIRRQLREEEILGLEREVRHHVVLPTEAESVAIAPVRRATETRTEQP